LVSRVTLFDFGARQAGLAAAEARRSGADAGVAATRANLRATVQAAFHALAIAQDLQQVAAKNLERAEQHHRLADLRQQAGAVPQADVLRTAATEAEARLQLITAESRVRRAAGELNTAMGRAADTALTIAQTETLTPPAPVDYTAAVEQALARRPELLASNQRTVAAQAAVTAAKAARAPRLNADASFGWRDSAWVPETREWQAGLTIDLPLFDAGGRKRGVARARAEVAREEATDANLRLQVRQEVWSAQVEMERAWAAIAANEAGVRAAAESLRAVRERYEFGAAIITDLLDTQTALARTEASLAEAKGQYRTARVYFERAVGTGEKPDGKL
jgi:outer membrane protein TolC